AGGIAGPRRASASAPTRPASVPARRPRRVSGPAPRRRSETLHTRTMPARMGRFVRGLPDHSLLDQIVRGRAWIPLLGVLLAGIVAMQVEVLKLSANMGRSLERGTALQSRNEQLRASVAQLSDDQRIERIAAQMGMVMPAPTAVKFLAQHPAGQLGRALAGIHSPNPTAFAAGLPGAQAALGTGGAAAGTPSAGTPPAAAVTTPATGSTATTTPGVPTSAAATSPASSGAAPAVSSTPAVTSPPAGATTPATSAATGNSTGSTAGAAAAGTAASGTGG
ncbi:MAG TPA: hypothetical protein VF781_00885, partial [Solirubrobacteraceae bacterium]